MGAVVGGRDWSLLADVRNGCQRRVSVVVLVVVSDTSHMKRMEKDAESQASQRLRTASGG